MNTITANDGAQKDVGCTASIGVATFPVPSIESAQALLRQHLPDSAWAPLIIKLGYAVGFLIVILGRQQLFTENTLTVILPLLLHKTGSDLFKVLRLWTVVLGANLVGAFAFAWVAAKTGAFEPEVRAALDAIASERTAQSFAINLLRGVLAGWLIALMVWL